MFFRFDVFCLKGTPQQARPFLVRKYNTVYYTYLVGDCRTLSGDVMRYMSILIV